MIHALDLPYTCNCAKNALRNTARGAEEILMPRYRLQVQIIEHYQLTQSADSEAEALAVAELLPARRIIARGRRVGSETGLADPASVKPID